MIYDDIVANALTRLHDEQRYRVYIEIERIAGRCAYAVWQSPRGPRDIVIWCSNDYLGMSQHPEVVKTASRTGTGAGGTRNISGTNSPLVELERELADLHGKRAALVFTSGYVSNQAGVSTISAASRVIIDPAASSTSRLQVLEPSCEA
jgi:5-aminolevulinate synthase